MGKAQCVFEDWQDVIGISYFAIEIVSVNLLTNYKEVLENMKDQSAWCT